MTVGYWSGDLCITGIAYAEHSHTGWHLGIPRGESSRYGDRTMVAGEFITWCELLDCFISYVSGSTACRKPVFAKNIKRFVGGDTTSAIERKYLHKGCATNVKPPSITLRQVAVAGYPGMGNVTVDTGRKLLNLLAQDSDEADEFRRFVLRQSTTYYGDSDDWWVDIFAQSSLSVNIRHTIDAPEELFRPC